MDMDMNPTAMDMNMTMVPWFHFTGGDHLYFESWRPTSPGAIVGACIGLVCLALFERWFSSTRRILDAHWRHKTISLTSKPIYRTEKASPSSSSRASKQSFDSKIDTRAESEPRKIAPHQMSSMRTIPPFILAHDLPRGIMHAGQSLLGYLLMLAVMTFNAGFIISIVAGLGIGEVIFGRMGKGSTIH